MKKLILVLCFMIGAQILIAQNILQANRLKISQGEKSDILIKNAKITVTDSTVQLGGEEPVAAVGTNKIKLLDGRIKVTYSLYTSTLLKGTAIYSKDNELMKFVFLDIEGIIYSFYRKTLRT